MALRVKGSAKRAALKQASAGCGLQLHDTSDATCHCSSACGTPDSKGESPVVRVSSWKSGESEC